MKISTPKIILILTAISLAVVAGLVFWMTRDFYINRYQPSVRLVSTNEMPEDILQKVGDVDQELVLSLKEAQRDYDDLAQSKIDLIKNMQNIGNYDYNYLLINGWYNIEYGFEFVFDRPIKAGIDIHFGQKSGNANIALYDIPFHVLEGSPNIVSISIDKTFDPTDDPPSFNSSFEMVDVGGNVWYVDVMGEFGCNAYAYWFPVAKEAYVQVAFGRCLNDETVIEAREEILGNFSIIEE